jgi:hypothetical protein
MDDQNVLGEEEGKEVQRQEEEEEAEAAEAAEAAEVRRTGGGKRNIKIEGQQCGPPQL